MRSALWRLVPVLVLLACSKEAPTPGAEGRGAERPAADAQAPGPYVITPAKLEAYVGYQRRMLQVYENVQREMTGLETRTFEGDASKAAQARLKLIEGKAQAEEEARREAQLTVEDVNGIAEVVTAVVSQRQLARQMGFDEELKKLEALQARLTPEQQKELAPQVAAMRQRAQDFEGLEALRRAHGEASVAAVLEREAELTQNYQAMLRVFNPPTAQPAPAPRK